MSFEGAFELVDLSPQAFIFDEHFLDAILMCRNCGHGFSVDTATDYNMIFNFETCTWEPECPKCGNR